jgi:hypothetical protein
LSFFLLFCLPFSISFFLLFFFFFHVLGTSIRRKKWIWRKIVLVTRGW